MDRIKIQGLTRNYPKIHLKITPKFIQSEKAISGKHSYINKGGSRHKNWCMARVLGFLIRYFSNYYTLHRSDLAARAAPLDPRLYKYRKNLTLFYRYGDVVPKKIANKFIGVIFMIIGLIFASLLTATITDFVFNANYQYLGTKVCVPGSKRRTWI